MKYEVVLSEAQAKALSIIAVDPEFWIQNAAENRANIAIEEIFQQEVARMLQDPTITEIPADRETVVLNYQPIILEKSDEAAI
jgi:hypothetical protein